MGKACNTHGRQEEHIMVGRLEKPLGRPRRSLDDSIKTDLREIGWVNMSWIHVGQGRDQWRADVNTVMNIPVP
jgi:hypothetical protein